MAENFYDNYEKTEETLFDGALVCRQPRLGYRYSVDAVLLAHFIEPGDHAEILDLGAGCGIISLILAYRFPTVAIKNLELQKNLARLCRENISANNLDERIVTTQGDLCSIEDLFARESFSLVVSNPPYRKIAGGRVSIAEEEALARHEIAADLPAVIHAASHVLKTKGRAVFVYPASRLSSLITCLKEKKLEPKRLQVVYGYPGGSAKLVLVEAVKDGGEELKIVSPHYIQQTAGGEYTSEMAACYKA